MDSAVRCVGLAKAFGGVPVLRDVSLDLAPGTVTVLAGENGAGKSTVMKAIAGLVRPDAGSVEIHGTALRQADPLAARALGVAMVPQELAPFPDLTVYENLFVGRELHGRSGLLDRRRMVAESRRMLEAFEVDIDPRTPAHRLSVAMLQLVEIAKATTRGATVLLLDEPTSAIPTREVDDLYRVVGTLRSRGVCLVYTTHKMAEIQAIADRVVVLRDGELVFDRPLADAEPDSIVTAMIGRELGQLFPAVRPAGDDVVLDVKGLRLAGEQSDVDLQVRRGEILGLAGLVGAGRTEALEGIFGARATTAGEISVGGRRVRRNDAAAAITAGMALVPEDRKNGGLVMTMDVLDNGALPRLNRFVHTGWLRQRRRRSEVGSAMESVRLRSRGLGQSVETLSGGNQQKVVLARWLTDHVDVLLLDEPTRGIDIGARGEIYRLIADLAAAGMAIVMASSDMTEVLGLSHRVAVFRAGAVVGELDHAQLQAADAQEAIFRLAAELDRSAPYVEEDVSP